MKIMFTYLNPMGLPYIDLGIASLSATLKSKGHDTKLLDFTFGMKNAEAVRQVKEYDPDIICITAKTNEFSLAVQFATLLKKNFDKPIFCGGIHPTVAPEDAVKHPCFDGICRGEGEVVLLELVRKIEKKEDYTDTLNFWFRKGGKIIRNEIGTLVENLDSLPLFDYDIYDMEKYLRSRAGNMDYILSRGCPFTCTYCINNVLQKIYAGKGKYVRSKSVGKIMQELKELKGRYEVVAFRFHDEMFNIDHKRLKEFCETYAREIKTPFECDLRVDFCSEEMFQWLKNAGCFKVSMAIESGDPELREKLLNKKITDDQIIGAFRWAKKAGIHTMSYNMLGFPFETREQMQKTIDINREIKADSIQASIFTPFPGTNLREFSINEGILKKDDFDMSYYTGTYLRNDKISDKELFKIQKRFAYYCYKDRSLPKALLLLLRGEIIPVYLKAGRHIPVWFKYLIYKIFWNSKVFRFMSK
ncbi:MAG: radical SAM protein [Candidatus Aenigmatarchaeota archaeon]